MLYYMAGYIRENYEHFHLSRTVELFNISRNKGIWQKKNVYHEWMNEVSDIVNEWVNKPM